MANDRALLDEPRRLERRTRTLLRLSRMISDRRLAHARAHERPLVDRIKTLFDRHDVLLTPVIARPAPPADHWTGRGAIANLIGNVPWIAFTQVWNLTGQPAISLPAGVDHDGMPLSVQLIGAPDSEPVLLHLASQIEDARPWTDRHPPLSY